MRTLLASLIALSGVSSVPKAEPVVAVVVLDAAFAQVKVLSAAECESFGRMWQGRREVAGSAQDAGGTHYKLDVRGPRGSRRHLYYTSGRVALLAHNLQPTYVVADPQAFNRLIGSAE